LDFRKIETQPFKRNDLAITVECGVPLIRKYSIKCCELLAMTAD
jgi:hypothetical protein